MSRRALSAMVDFRARDSELALNGGWHCFVLHHIERSGAISSRLQSRLWRIAGNTMVTCRAKWPRAVPLRVRHSIGPWWPDNGPQGKSRELIARRSSVYEWRQRIERPRFDGLTCGFCVLNEAAWEDYTIPWGDGAEPMTISLTLREADNPSSEPLWAATVPMPITLVDRIEDAIAPVADEQVAAWLRQSMTLHVRPDAVSLGFSGRACPSPITLALRVRFECDGEEVAVARWWGREGRPGSAYLPVALEGDGVRVAAANFKDGHWAVRVESDAEFALRDFESDQHWSGAITLDPVRMTQNQNRLMLQRPPRQ